MQQLLFPTLGHDVGKDPGSFSLTRLNARSMCFDTVDIEEYSVSIASELIENEEMVVTTRESRLDQAVAVAAVVLDRSALRR